MATIRSNAHKKGKATIAAGGGKFPFISLCLLVLCILFAIVSSRFLSSLVDHGETAVGSFASTKSIRTVDDGDDDDDDYSRNDAGRVTSGSTMQITEGLVGSFDADDDPTATTTPAQDDFELATGQSNGFFYDVPARSWNLLRDIYLKHENHRNPSRPLLYSKHDPYSLSPWDRGAAAWYQNNFEPNFSCQFEKRIGGMNMNGDGPKWVCDPHRIRKLALERKARDPDNRGCVVYSIGSNGDFNFELGMQKEIGEGICEFHIFDMGSYEGKMPKELKRAYYHQWGLKKQDYSNVDAPSTRGMTWGLKKQEDPSAKTIAKGQTYYGLLDTVKLLGHEKLDVIDIFKIDCEKCEWETYMDWLAEGVPTLHQIQVEVHDVPGEAALTFFDSMEAAGYLRYHKEPNIQYGPNCIEYGMVKVSTDFMNGKNFTFNKLDYTMANGRVVARKAGPHRKDNEGHPKS